MNLFPKQPAFFKAFEDLATIVYKTGTLLSQVEPTSKKSMGVFSKKARKLELEADEICHTIYHQADSTFITPIDREDIQVLAKSLDNIIDLVENVIANLELFQVKRTPKEFVVFVKLTEKATKEVLQLIQILKLKGSDMNLLRKQIVKIHTLENDGDTLFRNSLQTIFKNGKDAVEIIKWKDVFENLEEILDECEDTSDIVEAIVIKNF